MSSHFSKTTRAIGAVTLASLATIAARAQVTVVDWIGVDSNYLNPANWSTGAVPDGTSGLRLTATPTTRIINLANTGAGDVTYQVNAIRTGVSYGYTFNLSGTQNGRLVYNIVGRGTHPYNTEPTSTSTGNSANRLSSYYNVGPYTTITFDGSTTLASGSTSGLTYANINLTGNSFIDGSTIGGNRLEIGLVNIEQGSSVYLGAKGLTISGLTAAGLEEVWAGHLYQDAGNVEATQKWGTGITRVATTGVVDLPGEFRLRANGQYLVDGVHNGRISSVGGGSVIGGTGVINGPSISDSAATVRPLAAVNVAANTSIAPAGRDATGLLTINGHVINNGSLSFELFSPTAFDRLVINGDLTLGATSALTVGLAETFPLQPGTFRLLTVTGTNYDVDAMSFLPNAIEGEFGSVALPSSQGLAASYVMTSNYIDVIFTQLAFATNPLLYGNQKALAAHIDAAVADGRTPLSLLDTLNRAPSIILFREILDQLSPTAYQSWYPSAVTRTNSMVQTLDDQVSQSWGLGREKGSMETFFQGYRQESSRDADLLAAYSNYDTIAALGGFDYALGGDLLAGGFISYETTEFDLDVYAGSSTVESVTAGVYASHRRGALDVSATAFGGVDDYESRRSVVRTKLGQWVASTTEGTRYGAKIGAAYRFQFPWLEVTPTVALQYLRWDAKAFSEAGSSEANLRVKYQTETSIAARGGVRLARTFAVGRGELRPFVNIAWQQEFNDDDREMKADIFGGTVTTYAPGIESGGVRLDCGLDWKITDAIGVNARYLTERGGAQDESVGIRGGVTIAF